MSEGRLVVILCGALALLSAAVLGLVFAAPGRADMTDDVVGSARVIDGATVEVEGRRLRLEGIAAPAPGTRCRLRGNEQDCGRISTAALIDLTAGVEIACLLRADTAQDGTRYARCHADGYDLSEGMVHAGWARADLGQTDRYVAFEAEARAARRGMWRSE